MPRDLLTLQNLARPLCSVQKAPGSSPSLAWYAILSIVLGCVVVSAVLCMAWFRLGPQMAMYRTLAAKKHPPGLNRAGKDITLVLSDMEGSTELWWVCVISFL